MKAISGKRLCRLLQARGWRLARVRGSHHIFVKPGTNVRISVPVHGNRTLKRGLAEIPHEAGGDRGGGSLGGSKRMLWGSPAGNKLAAGRFQDLADVEALRRNR